MQRFKTVGRCLPTPNIPAPVFWGDEPVVREQFGSSVARLRLTRVKYRFDYPFEPAGVVDLFRDRYGPTVGAFAALPADGKAAPRDDLVNLWAAHNRSCEPGRTIVDADYLDVEAIRARGRRGRRGRRTPEGQTYCPT